MNHQEINRLEEKIVYSPQEKRVLGREEQGRGRVGSLLSKISGKRPTIDIERALFFTRSFQETVGDPLNLRWAKALKKICQEITVYVIPDQLLLGRTGKPGRHGILYPELDGDFLDSLANLSSRESSPYSLDPQDLDTILREIYPFWKGKTYHEALNAALPEDIRILTYDDPQGIVSRFIVNETSSFRSSIQWVHDYEKVLKFGLKKIHAEARAALEALDPLSPRDNLQQKPFYESVLLVCEGLKTLASRYSLAARKAAEDDPQRSAELLNLAEILTRVPWEPAQTFHEALESQWLTQVFSRLEQKTGTIISNGRMDQYLYPFYARDLEQGIITEDKALELLECLWVNLAEFVDLYISPTGGAFNEGYAHWEAVTIGGQTPDGEDATNPLTHLFLRSKREFPLHYPDLAARIHLRSPETYLADVVLTIKDGTGFPKIINDEEVVPLYVKKGATFREALDYAVSGCSEARMPNRDTYTSGGAYINFAAALEMTLRNGRLLKYGDQLLGVETGDPRNFQSFFELWEAYLKQHYHLLRAAFIQQYHVNKLRAEHFAQPFGSALHDLAMKYGIDLHQEFIPEGINLGYVEFIGYATVTDSLAALKKVVFTDQKLSMCKVMEALDHNFQGYEVARALLRRAPRYGNNDPEADLIARELDRVTVLFAEKYSRELGINNDVRYVPFTSHVPFGKVISATPNGREAWFPLSDGSSPSQGADIFGPTAILLSNFHTKNHDLSARAARMLNVKFTPQCLQGEEGTQKLMAFIRAFCDLKLWHIQFNVINQETLRLAQQNPEDYPNLIVRIAGYSAYFTDLSVDLQNDLIARQAHTDLVNV
ncbi:MAG: glycyl radical protein [Deltaproteobacteria bacterium]|nr:glycyl radical protein [Deltaproteobacteria bacterium]